MSDREPQKKPPRSEKSRDRPANASELEQAEIPLERERNSVRREQEGLKDSRMRRWGFGVGIGLAVVVVVGIVVAVIHGDLPAASLAPVLSAVIGVLLVVLRRF